MEGNTFITLEHDTDNRRGVCFYNYHSSNFVQVAIEETRRRIKGNRKYFTNNSATDTFYAILYGVIREYQLYYNSSSENVVITNRDDINGEYVTYNIDDYFFCDIIKGIYLDGEQKYINDVREFYNNVRMQLEAINALPETAYELYTNLVKSLNTSLDVRYFLADEKDKCTIIGYVSEPDLEVCTSDVEFHISEYIDQYGSNVRDMKPWDLKYI